MATDIGLIIAIVGSAIAIVGVVIAMMFWSRTEANSVREEMRGDRKDLLQITRNIENTIREIRDETKDFHRRLCQIEENRRYVIYKDQ